MELMLRTEKMCENPGRRNISLLIKAYENFSRHVENSGVGLRVVCAENEESSRDIYLRSPEPRPLQ